VDLVDVGLLHLAQELPRIRAQALDVAALALGVDRVEGKARLPAPAQAGDHDQAITRERDRDVLQVVFACSANDDLILGHVAKCTRIARNRTDVSVCSGTSRVLQDSGSAPMATVFETPPAKPIIVPAMRMRTANG